MTNKFLTVSDGTFTLAETENKNQLYIMQKIMNGDINDIVMNDIYSEISDDKKCLRLTICDILEPTSENDNSNNSKKQPNFFKKLFKNLFG